MVTAKSPIRSEHVQCTINVKETKAEKKIRVDKRVSDCTNIGTIRLASQGIERYRRN